MEIHQLILAILVIAHALLVLEVVQIIAQRKTNNFYIKFNYLIIFKVVQLVIIYLLINVYLVILRAQLVKLLQQLVPRVHLESFYNQIIVLRHAQDPFLEILLLILAMLVMVRV